jgi:hypothetical protein
MYPWLPINTMQHNLMEVMNEDMKDRIKVNLIWRKMTNLLIKIIITMMELDHQNNNSRINLFKTILLNLYFIELIYNRTIQIFKIIIVFQIFKIISKN